jgi:hypothetical protein
MKSNVEKMNLLSITIQYYSPVSMLSDQILLHSDEIDSPRNKYLSSDKLVCYLDIHFPHYIIV